MVTSDAFADRCGWVLLVLCGGVGEHSVIPCILRKLKDESPWGQNIFTGKCSKRYKKYITFSIPRKSLKGTLQAGRKI